MVAIIVGIILAVCVVFLVGCFIYVVGDAIDVSNDCFRIIEEMKVIRAENNKDHAAKMNIIMLEHNAKMEEIRKAYRF